MHQVYVISLINISHNIYTIFSTFVVFVLSFSKGFEVANLGARIYQS